LIIGSLHSRAQSPVRGNYPQIAGEVADITQIAPACRGEQSAQPSQERVPGLEGRQLDPGGRDDGPVRAGDDRIEVEAGHLGQVVGQPALSGDIAACMALTASKSAGVAGRISTVVPSASSAYTGFAGIASLTFPVCRRKPNWHLYVSPRTVRMDNSQHSSFRAI
jgi:hypothetical protein